jgi:hypothetical protein
MFVEIEVCCKLRPTEAQPVQISSASAGYEHAGSRGLTSFSYGHEPIREEGEENRVRAGGDVCAIVLCAGDKVR